MDRAEAQISFTSGSARARARKEFVFAGPSGLLADRYNELECEELRSDRFERKGRQNKNHNISENVVVSRSRDSDDQGTFIEPVLLGSIHGDDIASSHNLETFPYAFEQDLDVLHWACGMAGLSPTARALLKETQMEGWSICLDDLGMENYAIDDEAHCITLNHFGFTANALGRSGFYRNALFINFVKALRDIWHEGQSHDFTNSHRPDAVLMLERARSADLETIAILAGWELRAAGYADLWRFILGSEEGDMAMIFTRAIEKDPAGFYDGSVLTRTFCQWYGDEGRVASSDHNVLEQMDMLMEEAQGAQVFGNKPMIAGDIEKLAKLPGSRAYLEGMGRNICTDPYFASMNDPINESHLFQICYDSKVVMVEGVPFRDKKLARLIFPTAPVKVKE